MEPTLSHAYGDHPDQHVDWYASRVARPLDAVIVVVHGGYWRERVTASSTEALVGHLLKSGHDVANVEYRRGRRTGAWPVVRDDVRAAIAAVREHIGGQRPLIGIGHSVGGQLVLLAASQLDAIVALAPVTDIARVHRENLGDGAAAEYFGSSATELEAEASPIRQPAPDVPTLIVHGRPDDRVPLDHTLAYLGAHSPAPIDLIVDHAASHIDLIDPDLAVWRLLDVWLAQAT